MSISKQLHIPDNEPPNKPEFKLPEGYTMRWRVNGGLGKGPAGGFILRDPKGKELGFFEMKPGKKTVKDVLQDHLSAQVVGETRDTLKAFVVLVDSDGRPIGSLDIKKPAKNPIEAMLKDLGNS